ncbi:hypothetical protein AVEN_141858-1 [Araneus ventricosus]|uniref:Uncharacterized protein n=1 Tax=Araneus ventricosus TaxID=182803 RepID=A0A4Y2L2X4_ARAVE|nr:hypothetical protein AVEN_141858-1 [Araneus ventricosus]
MSVVFRWRRGGELLEDGGGGKLLVLLRLFTKGYGLRLEVIGPRGWKGVVVAGARDLGGLLLLGDVKRDGLPEEITLPLSLHSPPQEEVSIFHMVHLKCRMTHTLDSL